MSEQAEFPNRAGLKYARSLLNERREELQTIELKHLRMPMSQTDYLSCRLSLLQGINELEALLRELPDCKLAEGVGGKMSVQCLIDVEKRTVWTTLSGVITCGDLASRAIKLRDEPGFDPGFDQLVTFAGDVNPQLCFSDMLSLSGLNPFSCTSRHAAVIRSGTAVYGVVRILQAVVDDSPYLRIFDTTEEAKSWLTAGVRLPVSPD